MPKYRAESENDFDTSDDIQCKASNCALCRAAREEQRDEDAGKAARELTARAA